MKKIIRKVLPVLLSVAMIFGNNMSVAASDYGTHTVENTNNQETVIVTDEGVYINGTYYSQEAFIQLLETAQEVQSPQTRMAGVIAGTWWIPGVGEVVITAAGVILVAGVVIEAGSWIYDTVTQWFQTRAEISEAKGKIPERLKDGNGEVDLGNFDQKVNGKTAYKEKGGWTIEKDTAGHGGRAWKLKDKSGNRVASLDENGKVLGK